jgi:hypothetical protein
VIDNPLFLTMDGLVMAVLRPADPERAIRRAKELASKVSSRSEFDALLAEQPHTYRGIAGVDRKVYDEDGAVLEDMRPGDSYAPYEEVRALMEKLGRIR